MNVFKMLFGRYKETGHKNDDLIKLLEDAIKVGAPKIDSEMNISNITQMFEDRKQTHNTITNLALKNVLHVCKYNQYYLFCERLRDSLKDIYVIYIFDKELLDKKTYVFEKYYDDEYLKFADSRNIINGKYIVENNNESFFIEVDNLNTFSEGRCYPISRSYNDLNMFLYSSHFENSQAGPSDVNFLLSKRKCDKLIGKLIDTHILSILQRITSYYDNESTFKIGKYIIKISNNGSFIFNEEDKGFKRYDSYMEAKIDIPYILKKYIYEIDSFPGVSYIDDIDDKLLEEKAKLHKKYSYDDVVKIVESEIQYIVDNIGDTYNVINVKDIQTIVDFYQVIELKRLFGIKKGHTVDDFKKMNIEQHIKDYFAVKALDDLLLDSEEDIKICY